jgi:hypothetical protein
MPPSDLTTYDLTRAKVLVKRISKAVEGDQTIDIALALALFTAFIAQQASTDHESAKSFLRSMQGYQDELLEAAFTR